MGKRSRLLVAALAAIAACGGDSTAPALTSAPRVVNGASTTVDVLKAVVDAGSIVPAGKSKLEVIHLAAGAGSIEIWRTQPDFPSRVHIMTPFDNQAQPPYLQSDAGPREVFVTRPGSKVKLATTGVIMVPAGERRTAVLLDSAGVLRFSVLGN